MATKKNHYVVLGVSRNESPDGIRRAYRRLAKASHPDRAGARGASSFRDVAEAYGVLSDPEKRRRYNRALDRRAAEARPSVRRRRRAWTPEPEPLVPADRAGERIEPLIPERPGDGARFAGPASHDRTLELVRALHLRLRGRLGHRAAGRCPVCAGGMRLARARCPYCRGRSPFIES